MLASDGGSRDAIFFLLYPLCVVEHTGRPRQRLASQVTAAHGGSAPAIAKDKAQHETTVLVPRGKRQTLFATFCFYFRSKTLN